MKWLLLTIFRHVYPVWDRYRDDVPEAELQQLDQELDAPSGVAAAAVARLNSDEEFRNQLKSVLWDNYFIGYKRGLVKHRIREKAFNNARGLP